MRFSSIFRAAAGALLVFALAGCGGGGGGGTSAPGVGSGDGSVVFADVSINLRSPAAVKDVSFGGSSPHGVELQIGYSGDVNALAGRTVYLLVQMPDPLYESRPVYSADPNNPIIYLSLGGNLQGVPEGRYTGNMKVYACLDPTCSTQLRNSPLSIPYDVEMKPGLKLSPSSLNLQTTFGTALPTSEVAVSVPFGGTDWSFISGDSMGVSVARSGNELVATPSPFARPGTYTNDVIIQSSAPDPQYPGTIIQFGKTLKVTYTVNPSGTPYVMSPTSASYVLTLNDPTQRYDKINFGLQEPGSALDLRGVRYDANPAAAAGHPGVNQWLWASAPAIAEYFVIPCGTDPTSRNCLPAGTYQASILYRQTSTTGVKTDFEFPVAMTIAP